MTAKEKTARVLEVIVGLVFLVAALGKMANVAGFAELIIRYGFPPLSILAPAIVATEALCGMMLVLGIWPRLTAAVTGLMLVAFTAAFFYANTYRGVTDCGCFGPLGPSAPAWLTYGRNAVLAAMCVLILLWAPKDGNANSVKWAVVSVGMFAAAFAIGFTFRLPSYYHARLSKPHPLLGRTIDDIGIRRYVETCPDSTYVVYVFSYGCATCLDGINNIKQYDDREIADRMIGLPVTDDTDSVIHRAFGIDFFEVNVGQGLRESVKQIPVLLYVEGDTVKYVIEGTVPSAYNFKKYYLDK